MGRVDDSGQALIGDVADELKGILAADEERFRLDDIADARHGALQKQCLADRQVGTGPQPARSFGRIEDSPVAVCIEGRQECCRVGSCATRKEARQVSAGDG